MNQNSPLRDLFLIDRGLVFLNHGSFGACPLPVMTCYQEYQRELERQPVEFLGRRFNDLMREARGTLASYVHCDPDELVYVPNATTAVNVVARSLNLQPGDEVLSTDHEYGAMDRTWRFVCGKRGAIYRQQPMPLPVTTPAAWVDRLWEAVTRNTRVIFMSHITSPTALILPVDQLCARARAAGILTVIDGAHAAGQIPLELHALGPDFYTSNAHKWMMSAKGSAFLYARREAQSQVEPLVVSWGWQAEKPGPSRFIDEQEWTGTRDIAAFLTVPDAIRFMAEHDWDRVRADCHALVRYARTSVSSLTGLEPISPDSREWFTQMASFPLPQCDGDELKQRLYDDYRVEVPIVKWNGRLFLRVSIQGYNARQDVDKLMQALSDLLPLVRTESQT